jgi:hypothetical protein
VVIGDAMLEAEHLKIALELYKGTRFPLYFWLGNSTQ